ncbi:MAG: DUF3754 domain-containing protein [Thiotrichales bacterium]
MLNRAALQTETFIPVSRFALVDYLARTEQWQQASSQAISQFFSSLSGWRHESYKNRLARMKSAYLAFSPDRDTKQILEYSEAERRALQETLIADLKILLAKANYISLSRTDLESIFQKNNAHGLELTVDLSEYEEMLLFYRGLTETQIQTRCWKTLFLKKKTVESRKFQRLFLLLKLKPEQIRIEEIMREDSVSEKHARRQLIRNRKALPENSGDEQIYLKLFKNIPEIEMEMLFPNTRVALKPFDKLKLGITAGGGTSASVIATATKFTAAANPMTAAAALAGLVGAVFRQVSKILVQRNKYSMLLAQKLFFHNLANNRSVLALLSDRAEEEEFKEAVLTFFFISNGAYQPENLDQLSTDIEVFMHTQFGVETRFEAQESVDDLLSEGLVEVQSGTLVTTGLPAATDQLRALTIGAIESAHIDTSTTEA